MGIYSCLDSVQSWLFPRHCPVCAERLAPRGDWLCATCLTDLRPLIHACPRCSVPLPASRVCGECLQTPPPVDAALAAFRYLPPVSQLIPQLKYHDGLHLVQPLALALAEAARSRPPPDALLPVPLHPARLRERGFNQSLEIARHVGRALSLPLLARAARRTRATPPQQGLDERTRQRNLRDAFALTAEGALHLPGKSVAIVDDVMTTGATVYSLARCLRAAGVHHIEVWVIARAARD
jgi:ComF family protein